MKPRREKQLLAILSHISLHLSEINQSLKELTNDEDNEDAVEEAYRNGQSLRFGPAEPAFPAQEPTP